MIRGRLIWMLVALLAATALADDAAAVAEDAASQWPQWRGPLGTGVAPLADPPLRWDEETHLKWKVKIPGSGSSTPIVWGDQIFILTAIPTEREADALPEPEEPATRGGNPFRIERPTRYQQFVVLSIDRRSGDVLWQDTATEQVPHEGAHQDHGFASASPTTDGEFLYVSFGSRGIYCYDLQGRRIWDRDLGDMQVMRYFGESISPVLHDGVLVVPWDHEGESFIVALDGKTGETRWRVARPSGSAWSTPLVIEHGDKTQVIVSGRDRIHSYDLDTGAVLWESGRPSAAAIPVPVATESLVISMTGYPLSSRSLYAIPLDARGDITDQGHLAWSRDRGTPYVPSPLLVGDTLYFNSGNTSVLTSVKAATGEVVIDQQRIPGLRNIYSSPVSADGRIYITGREGKTVVIQAGPELEVLATNQLDDQIDASAALVGNEIIMRGKTYLYCIAE